MEQKPKSWRTAAYAGAGMAVGAALGLLFGLMLLEDVIAGPLVGAVAGAVIGIIHDMLSNRERKACSGCCFRSRSATER